MSSKSRVKFVMFVVGIAVAAPAGILALSLLSQFVAAFQEGADPASIFRGHALIRPADEEARWLPASDLAGSEPSLGVQEEIIAAYWLAWEAVKRAHLTGDTADLATYWAGSAYDFALSGIDPDHQSIQAHAQHALQLTYFSDDGSVVAFEDKTFDLVWQVGEESISLAGTASVVMTLDQGFWRVRSITVRYD